MITTKGFVNGKEVTFEVERFGTLAHGVLVKCGETSVLCTTVVGEKTNKDFLDLSVTYIEKFSAINKIPGGYKKREGALSDKEILISRLIDRSLRPIIDPLFDREIQIFVQVLSFDGYSTEVLAVAGCSLSLNLAKVIDKIISAAKFCNDEFNDGQMTDGLDFFHAVCEEKTIMIESVSIEAKNIQTSIELLKRLNLATMKLAVEMEDIQKSLLSKFNILKIEPKKLSWLKCLQIKFLTYTYNKLVFMNFDHEKEYVKRIIKKYGMNFTKHFYVNFSKYFSEKILKNKKRMDSRLFNQIRPFNSVKNVFSKLDGSATFKRGKTEVLASFTKASMQEAQSVDNIRGFYKDGFMVHYNFLPFCVGETGRYYLSRREIGHSELIRKALSPMLSKKYDALRVVIDVLSCDGSSSMAGVCAASLALKAYLKKKVAGISVGMVGSEYLVDLNAFEDRYLSKVDCKIAGTENEITAIQLDVKHGGLTIEEFEGLLEIGHSNIGKILHEMNEDFVKFEKKANFSLNSFKF